MREGYPTSWTTLAPYQPVFGRQESILIFFDHPHLPRMDYNTDPVAYAHLWIIALHLELITSIEMSGSFLENDGEQDCRPKRLTSSPLIKLPDLWWNTFWGVLQNNINATWDAYELLRSVTYTLCFQSVFIRTFRFNLDVLYRVAHC